MYIVYCVYCARILKIKWLFSYRNNHSIVAPYMLKGLGDIC